MSLRARIGAVVLVVIVSSVIAVGPFTSTMADEDPPVFLNKWGTMGSSVGDFNEPSGMAADSQGNVYVADAANHRIQKFDGIEWTLFAGTGSIGAGQGEFNWPFGVDVDSSDNVYVADRMNNRIQKFDSAGGFILEWGESGTSDGQFNQPFGVGVTDTGIVFVADGFTTDGRVQKFTWNESEGKYEHADTWTGFDWPVDVDFDSAGRVYVTEHTGSCIKVFEQDGTPVTQIGTPGSEDGEFDYIGGAAIDASDNVFAVDRRNHRVQVLTTGGELVAKWGSQGSQQGEFAYPWGIAINSEGHIFVADYSNHRVQMFGEGAVLEIALTTGWNMVSVPINTGDTPASDVFDNPDAVYTLNPNGKSYTVPTTIEPEKGYWVAVSSDRTITITGEPVTEWTDEVLTGWNMIGSVHGASVDFSDPDDSPDSSVEGFLYSWDPTTKSYSYGTTVEQGKGYWAACTDACDLTVGPPPA